MKRFIWFIWLSLLTIEGITAQAYYDLYVPEREDYELPYHLLRKVQNLDDFIARYNGQHNAHGEQVDTTSERYKKIRNHPPYWQEYKYRIIGSLVDTIIINRDSLMVQSFAKRASKGAGLEYYSDKWHCEIPFWGTWKMKKYSGTLTLKVWYDAQRRSKWYIEDAVFDQTIDIVTESIAVEDCIHVYISPAAHDTHFIDLRRVLDGSEDLAHHIQAPTEGLTALKALIAKGSIPDFSRYYFHFYPASDIRFVVDDQYTITKIYENK